MFVVEGHRTVVRSSHGTVDFKKNFRSSKEICDSVECRRTHWTSTVRSLFICEASFTLTRVMNDNGRRTSGTTVRCGGKGMITTLSLLDETNESARLHFHCLSSVMPLRMPRVFTQSGASGTRRLPCKHMTSVNSHARASCVIFMNQIIHKF